MVLLVVKAIWMGESFNSFVINLVSLPTYVNLAHLFFFYFVFGYFFFFFALPAYDRSVVTITVQNLFYYVVFIFFVAIV
jgi:hypothetical protein